MNDEDVVRTLQEVSIGSKAYALKHLEDSYNRLMESYRKFRTTPNDDPFKTIWAEYVVYWADSVSFWGDRFEQ